MCVLVFLIFAFHRSDAAFKKESLSVCLMLLIAGCLIHNYLISVKIGPFSRYFIALVCNWIGCLHSAPEQVKCIEVCLLVTRRPCDSAEHLGPGLKC